MAIRKLIVTSSVAILMASYSGLNSANSSEPDQKLIQKFGYFAHLCTSNAVPEEEMAKACEEREALWEELYELGYTYGCPGDSDDKKYWRKNC